MKHVVHALMAAALISCASVSSPLDTRMSIEAKDAPYTVTPQASIGVIRVSLQVRNESDRVAKQGCGIFLERDTGSGFEVVVPGACIGTGALGEAINPGDIMPLEFPTNAPLTSISETAKYRVGLLFAFGPDFSSVVEIYSDPFWLIKQN
jgi:hypothetical protein